MNYKVFQSFRRRVVIGVCCLSVGESSCQVRQLDCDCRRAVGFIRQGEYCVAVAVVVVVIVAVVVVVVVLLL